MSRTNRAMPPLSLDAPWWVRAVAGLRTHCWACNIWRGIMVGFGAGVACAALAWVAL